jgi:hypothetical protein
MSGLLEAGRTGLRRVFKYRGSNLPPVRTLQDAILPSASCLTCPLPPLLSPSPPPRPQILHYHPHMAAVSGGQCRNSDSMSMTPTSVTMAHLEMGDWSDRSFYAA